MITLYARFCSLILLFILGCGIAACESSGGCGLQSAGDCKLITCGPQGEPVSIRDDDDAPDGDGFCTTGTCNAGVPGRFYHADWQGCGGTAACAAPSPSCEENDGGNNSELSAKWLGDLDDPDKNGRTRCGVLSHPDDVDWYSYHGHDTENGYVDPTRTLSGAPNVRICAYFRCDQPPKTARCPDGTVPDTSPGGVEGCCGFRTFRVDLWCAPTWDDDDATVLIRVDDPQHRMCLGYQLDYHY